MSELVKRAGDLLHQRWKAAKRKADEAPLTYSKLVLDPDGDPALAESLVDAMDEMGIGSKELSDDLFHVRLARRVVPRLQASREAERRAAEGIRAAELALHMAQATWCPQTIDRAHYELGEAIGIAADARRECEALLQELSEHAHRAPRVIRGQVLSIERAMNEADHRRAQNMTGAQGSSVPTAAPISAAAPAPMPEITSRATTAEASRRIAAAASVAVRQMTEPKIKPN